MYVQFAFSEQASDLTERPNDMIYASKYNILIIIKESFDKVYRSIYVTDKCNIEVVSTFVVEPQQWVLKLIFEFIRDHTTYGHEGKTSR